MLLRPLPRTVVTLGIPELADPSAHCHEPSHKRRDVHGGSNNQLANSEEAAEDIRACPPLQFSHSFDLIACILGHPGLHTRANRAALGGQTSTYAIFVFLQFIIWVT